MIKDLIGRRVRVVTTGGSFPGTISKVDSTQIYLTDVPSLEKPVPEGVLIDTSSASIIRIEVFKK